MDENKKGSSIKRWFADNGYDLVMASIIAIFIIGFILMLHSLSLDAGSLMAESLRRSQVAEDITAGYITDKKYINGTSNWFRTVPNQYRLYIEYSLDGETHEKFFSVSEEIYREYDIGEWFDSQSY